MSHSDIRIGTLAPLGNGIGYLKQMLTHGFESFQMTFWETTHNANLKEAGKEVIDTLAGQAVVSSLGMFCNPLQKPAAVKEWEKCIDNARHFGCDMVCGFAGALDGKPITDSIKPFKTVWSKLCKRAADKGVRIAFENCDMGGWWHSAAWNVAHSPTFWEIMFNEVPAKNLGLEWEPCHQMNSLIDPIPQLRKIAASGKVFHVHGKDATVAWDVIREVGIRGGKPYVWHRTPGFGDTNWTDVISILRMSGYKGTIDIEGWHDPVYRGDLETTGQVYALNYLKKCRGGPFVPNPK